MSTATPLGPRSVPHRTTLQRINAELALAGLEQGDGRALHRPMHVAVQTASGCNLECPMCLEHVRPLEERRGRNMKSFSLDLFAKLERDVLPYSSRMTFGIGGEPTFAENFEPMLRRAFEFGQEIELITNGTRLDVGTLAQTVADCVGYLQISIDAATPELYARIRVGAKLPRLVANIELLNQHRAKYSAVDRTHVSFWVTLMKSNAHELALIVELARRLDVQRVHAHHVSPCTPEAAADSLNDAPELWNAARAAAIAKANELGVELDVPEPLPVQAPASAAPTTCNAEATPPAFEVDLRAKAKLQDVRNSRMAQHAIPCHLPSTAVYFLWDGRVTPCCYSYAQDKMTMGHLATQSFTDIWNGPLYRALRVGMKVGDTLCICRHCPIVHDVPVTADEEAQMRASPTLEQWLAARETAPCHAAAAAVEPLERLRDGPVLAELDLLRRHARALEEDREHLRARVRDLEARPARLIDRLRQALRPPHPS